MSALSFLVQFETAGDCIKCGTPIVMPASLRAHKLKTQTDFYCINGHPQRYIGETEEAKLRRQLEFEKTRRASAEAQEATARKAEAIARGKLRAQTERVKNGVCPCCKRTFQNLMAHMKTKHPDFGETP
jgi:hypothetical protein